MTPPADEIRHVPLDRIRADHPPYPLDETFIDRYMQAVQGSLPTCFALIRTEGIRPHTDYQSTLSEGFLAEVLARVNAGEPCLITVYPNDDHFVMCDDYLLFHAYQALGVEEIPCHVLGEAGGPYVVWIALARL